MAANQHGRISHRTITMALSTKKGSRFNFLPNNHANFHHPPSPPKKKTVINKQHLFHHKKFQPPTTQKNNKTNKTLRQTTCRSVEVLVFLMWSEIWFLSLCLAIFAPDATSSGSLEGVEWVHGALSVIGFRNTSTKKGG